MKASVRVLVVDDSPVVRMRLCHMIEQSPGMAVAGIASNGREAIDQVLRHPPDVVLMDITMPRLDGLGATREIMARCPVPVVIMSSVAQPNSHVATFEAIEAGALAFVPKPAAAEPRAYAAQGKHLIATVRRMAEVKVVTRRIPRPPTPAAVEAVARRLPAAVVALGASTGGPPVLREILMTLGPDFPLPILAAQHISIGFETSLANWLNLSPTPTVKVARSGETMQPGVCHLAPAGAHMTVNADGLIRIEKAQHSHDPAPSVNRLFASVREAFGGGAIAALLTGMGNDGAAKLLRLRQAGALTLAQDEASSVVFGMPGAAVEMGAAVHVLSPAGIAQAILLAVKNR